MSAQTHIKRDVISAANRLRGVQTDFADEGFERQSQYLDEELGKLLKQIPYGRRHAFLEGLLRQFPVQQAVAGSDSNRQVPASPDSIVQAFLEVLPHLSPDQKQLVLQALPEKEGRARQAEYPLDGVDGIKSMLRLDKDADLHLDRLVLSARLLAEFVIKLEHLTAGVWNRVSPRSRIRPPKKLRKTIAELLSTEDGSTESLGEELKLLQQLTTAILTGVSRASEEFARSCSNRFSPETIRGLVEMEQGGLLDKLVSKEVKCWRKYCDLAESLSKDSVEREIETVIANYAEAFVRGMERLD